MRRIPGGSLTIYSESLFGSTKWTKVWYNSCAFERYLLFMHLVTSSENGCSWRVSCFSCYHTAHQAKAIVYHSCALLQVYIAIWSIANYSIFKLYVYTVLYMYFNSAVCLQEILIVWFFHAIYIFTAIEQRIDGLVLHTHLSPFGRVVESMLNERYFHLKVTQNLLSE